MSIPKGAAARASVLFSVLFQVHEADVPKHAGNAPGAGGSVPVIVLLHALSAVSAGMASRNARTVPLRALFSRVTFSSLLRLAHEAGTAPLKRLEDTLTWRRPAAPARQRAAS